jgi:sugar/nucleoside kinase (ribokinase family)
VAADVPPSHTPPADAAEAGPAPLLVVGSVSTDRLTPQTAHVRAQHGDGLWLSATTFAGRIRSHPDTVLALWNMIDVLICDVHEIRLLTGRCDLIEALHRAEQLTGSRVTCLTDTRRGGYLITEGTVTPVFAYPTGYPTGTADPTGARESFSGAVAAARLGGHGLLAAATIATATACVTVEGFGVARPAQADPADNHRRAATLAGAFLAGEASHG